MKILIESVTVGSPLHVLDQVRALFRAYGDFLQASGGAALFCFSRLEEEIADLPAAYSENEGELLVAIEGTLVAGCVAYRALTSPRENCAEIKRLFVSPPFRGQGLGKRLITAALARAQTLGYKVACLDTEPRSMAVAKQMYLDLGFVEDEERNSKTDKNIVLYFKKSLTPDS